MCSTSILGSALIVDAMALIQALPAAGLPTTFGELAELLLKRLSALASEFKSERVDFVGDRYPAISIKNAERNRRGQIGSAVVSIYSPTQKCPPIWKKFLANGKNKEALLTFLVDQWRTLKIESNLKLYATYGDKCNLLVFVRDSFPDVRVIDDLRSDHEEADTRMLAHAKNAAQDYARIIIRSPDTDVAIMCIAFTNQFHPSSLYFATGVKTKRRVLSMDTMHQSLKDIHQLLPAALLGFHALTGCDSTSAFYGKGKRSSFNVVKQDEVSLQTLGKIGEEFSSAESLLADVEPLVCKLYGSPSSTRVNDARFTMFCSKAGNEQAIPPTKQALLQHVKRANYQAAIWKRADKAMMEAPAPVGHGWVMEQDELSVLWTTADMAPPDVLKLVKCNCSKKKCVDQRCSCLRMQLKCTNLCSCSSCQNSAIDTDEPSAGYGDDDDPIVDE